MGHGDVGPDARRAGLAREGGLLVRAVGGAGLDRIAGPGLVLSGNGAGGGQGGVNE